MFKQLVKAGVRPLLSGRHFPVLVNSYGRSGSTLLINSVVESRSWLKGYFPNRVFQAAVRGQAWDLDSAVIKRGRVYKTHDYPPSLGFSEPVRMVYIFSNPIEVVKSLIQQYDKRGGRWMREHFEHLGSHFSDFFDIIDKDILGLQNHFEAWLQEQRFPVCFVRYESLWEYQESLGQFLETPLQLPPYRPRSSYQISSDDLLERLEHTYEDFKKDVLAKEDIFTNEKGRGLI